VASYNADINVNVRVLDQQLRDLEQRLNKLKNLNPFLPSGAARTAKKEIQEEVQRKNAIRDKAEAIRDARDEELKSLRLGNAKQLQETRLIALERANAFSTKARAKAIEKLNRVRKAFPDDPRIQERVATGLGRILSTQKEINRATTSGVQQRQRIADYDKEIKTLRKVGATEGELRKAQKRRFEFIDAAYKKQDDLANRREIQLRREIKTLQDKYRLELKAYNTAAKAESSPIRGSVGIPGSPKFIENLKVQGLALRKLAGSINTVINKSARLSSKGENILALPSSKELDAANKGIQRLVTNQDRVTASYDRQFRASQRRRASDEELAAFNRRTQRIGEKNAGRKLKEENKVNAALDKQEKLRARNARAAKRTADAAARKAKAARGRFAQNLSAGVGFPLLFGGGPGSVIGGALGAFGGFGGSVLGSAIGQQLDALGAAALRTANIFLKLTDNLDQLTSALGRGSAGGIGGTAAFLASQGLTAEAAEILKTRFDEVYGPGATKKFEELAQVSRDLKGVITELGIEFQSAMEGPLKFILNLLKTIRLEQQPQTELNALLSRQENDPRGLSILEKQRLAELQAGTTSDSAAGLSTEALTKLRKDTALLEKQATQLVEKRLTARRDDYAVLQGTAQLNKTQIDLNNTRNQLNFENNQTNKNTQKILELQTKEKELQNRYDREEAELANARLIAERAIRRETLQNQTATAAAFTQSVAAQRQLEDLSRSEAESYKTVNDFIQGNLQTREEVLGIQKQIELSGKTEQEVIDAIVFKYAALVELERDRAKLKEEQVRQAEILRQIEELRFRQSLTQATSDTRRSAEEQIRGTDPFRAFGFAGAGLGFFADSEQFQADRIASFNAQLERYNELIAAQQQIVAKGAAEGLDPDKQLGNKRELQRLQRARDDFELYQSQVDKAATSQARFNDALAAVSPGVNALVGGLQDIVAGTKTAQEVFADFLKTIADQLIQTAATMIAQYIAIGIAKAFAFGGGGGGFSGANSGLPTFGDYSGINLGGFGAFAEGGYVTGPTKALIGEGGEPEYVIPRSKMRESMARYSRGARGSSVIPSQAGGGDSEMSGGTAVAAPIDVRYTVERINSVDYVTADQFQLGMQRAAQQGAAEGERRTLRSLKNSPGTRRGVGM
jgi:hypothetical protein